MNSRLVFLCYRQDDGTPAANRLFDALNGQTLFPPAGFHGDAATICVYRDRASPAVSDWRGLHADALTTSDALVVVCTPGVKHEFAGTDEVYRELSWWQAHRATLAPILVTTQPGGRWVPDIVGTCWPDAQLVQLDPGSNGHFAAAANDLAIDTLLAGLATRFFRSSDAGDRSTSFHNLPGLYAWQKDRQLRYIACNENYARAAGFDSPGAMIGKTDHQMPWRALADAFRDGDRRVMSDRRLFRMNVTEKEIMVDRVADILVTENQLLDQYGRCVGVTGYFLDITGQQLVPGGAIPAVSGEDLALGNPFGNARFSAVESSVFRQLLAFRSAGRIAELLGLGRREVLRHLDSIRTTLQGRTLGDAIATAMSAGLPLTLFGTQLQSVPDRPIRAPALS